MKRFEWDEQKRIQNLKKHGLDFLDAYCVFDRETLTDIDDRYDYGETRFLTLGIIHGVVVVISHTEDDDSIRVISFRRADKYEQEIYFKAIRD